MGLWHCQGGQADFFRAPGAAGSAVRFCLAVPALALLWAALPAGPDMGALALPWLAVGCVLLCPALLDVTRYAPALTPLSRALPLSWYLLWADGTMPALLPLGAGLLWAAALAVQRLAKR